MIGLAPLANARVNDCRSLSGTDDEPPPRVPLSGGVGNGGCVVSSAMGRLLDQRQHVVATPDDAVTAPHASRREPLDLELPASTRRAREPVEVAGVEDRRPGLRPWRICPVGHYLAAGEPRRVLEPPGAHERHRHGSVRATELDGRGRWVVPAGIRRGVDQAVLDPPEGHLLDPLLDVPPATVAALVAAAEGAVELR